MQTKKIKTFTNSKSLDIQNIVYNEKYKVLAAPSNSSTRYLIFNADAEKNILIHKEILPKYSNVNKLFFIREWLIVTWNGVENCTNIDAFNCLTKVLVKTKSDRMYYYHNGNFGNCAIFTGKKDDLRVEQMAFCAETGAFTRTDADGCSIYVVYHNTSTASYCIACNKDNERFATIYEYSAAYEVPTYDNVTSRGRFIRTQAHGCKITYRKKHYLADCATSAPPDLYTNDGARVKIDLPEDYLNIKNSSFRTSEIIDSDGGEHYLILYHRIGIGLTLDVYYWCFRIDGEYGSLVWRHRLPAGSAEISSFYFTGAYLLHSSTLLSYPTKEDALLAGKLHLISFATGEIHSFDHAGEVIGGAIDCLPYGNTHSRIYDSGIYFTQGSSGLSMYALVQLSAPPKTAQI